MKSKLTLKKLLPIALLGALVALFYALFRLIFHPALIPKIININDADPATDYLDLRDEHGNSAYKFHVLTNDTVQWLVNTAQVGNIQNIYKKTVHEKDVFETGDPRRIGHSRNWTGTIRSDVSGQDENYNIDWIDSKGYSHTFDPKIQVY